MYIQISIYIFAFKTWYIKVKIMSSFLDPFSSPPKPVLASSQSLPLQYAPPPPFSRLGPELNLFHLLNPILSSRQVSIQMSNLFATNQLTVAVMPSNHSHEIIPLLGRPPWTPTPHPAAGLRARVMRGADCYEYYPPHLASDIEIDIGQKLPRFTLPVAKRPLLPVHIIFHLLLKATTSTLGCASSSQQIRHALCYNVRTQSILTTPSTLANSIMQMKPLPNANVTIKKKCSRLQYPIRQ